MRTSSPAELWDAIALEAEGESPLWREALKPAAKQEREAIFSALCEDRFALGVETIYEGYLVHYGRPRLFAPVDEDTALLLGDYLYAHGLVRIAAEGDVDAVEELAELISLCAQLRAEALEGDGAAWAATASLLGRAELDDSRAALRDGGDSAPLRLLADVAAGAEAVESALAMHAQRLE